MKKIVLHLLGSFIAFSAIGRQRSNLDFKCDWNNSADEIESVGVSPSLEFWQSSSLQFNASEISKCAYFQISGKDTFTALIPSDFPVMESSKPGGKEEFDAAVKAFKLKHPELKNVMLRPSQTPFDPNIFIVIPVEVFQSYMPERQKNIELLSPFFKISTVK